MWLNSHHEQFAYLSEAWPTSKFKCFQERWPICSGRPQRRWLLLVVVTFLCIESCRARKAGTTDARSVSGRGKQSSVTLHLGPGPASYQGRWQKRQRGREPVGVIRRADLPFVWLILHSVTKQGISSFPAWNSLYVPIHFNVLTALYRTLHNLVPAHFSNLCPCQSSLWTWWYQPH